MLTGHTIFITGATSGFGEACARLFSAHGARVIATGRRKERLELLAKENPLIHAVPMDVQDASEVQRVIAGLPAAFSNVDVLINNAGLALGLERYDQLSLTEIEQMVRTNINGVLYCTHALLPGMIARGRGHIVNLGSIAGTYPYPGGNVYGASKAFLAQFTLNLKADLLGKNIRVTNIEPGMCDTEFSTVRFHGDNEKAQQVYAGMRPLSADDIARTIFWTITQPAHININRVEIMPTEQAFSPFAVSRKN